MAYAIDKDLINERAYDGVRVPSYSGFALDSPYYNPDAQTPKYDPEKAAELVEELGGLEFTIVCIPTPEADEILNIIKALGEDVGMKITLESQEQGAYVNRMFSKGGDFEAGCFRSSHFIEPDAIRPGPHHRRRRQPRLLQQPRGRHSCSTRPARPPTSRSARRSTSRCRRSSAEEVPYLTTLYDLFGNVYDETRAGPPPPGEPNSLGAIKPGFLYAVG